jgi:hypothetical protein
MALSKWPLPCFAAVRRAEAWVVLLGEGAAGVDSESRVGRERSVVEVLKVCVNHPERRVGRSLMRDVDDVDE